MTHTLRTWMKRCRVWYERAIVPHPYIPPASDASHTCANCSTTFTGNFCPRCGQSTQDREHPGLRFTLLRIGESWGLSNWVMPRTLAQLLYRPGHLISDYLNGHRIGVFPPFKLVMLMAALYLLICNYCGADVATDASSQTTAATPAATAGQLIDYIGVYLDTHLVQTVVFIHAIVAMCTWLSFRSLPSRRALSLNDMFITQLFIIAQLLLISSIVVVLNPDNDYLGYDIPPALLVAVIFIDYWQLFGANLWSTFWRTLLSLLLSMLVFYILANIIIFAIYVYVAMETMQR